MSLNDGGPAFPVDEDFRDDGISRTRRRGGLSLRDYFAAHALAGDLAGQQAGLASDEDADFIAKRAYDFADAMLEERKARGAVDPPVQRHAKRSSRGKRSSSSKRNVG